MSSKCIVINLFRGLSAGKSTGTAYIKYETISENLQTFDGRIFYERS